MLALNWILNKISNSFSLILSLIFSTSIFNNLLLSNLIRHGFIFEDKYFISIGLFSALNERKRQEVHIIIWSYLDKSLCLISLMKIYLL